MLYDTCYILYIWMHLDDVQLIFVDQVEHFCNTVIALQNVFRLEMFG